MRNRNHHLLNRHGTYSFKQRIPADINTDGVSGFIQVSLRTTDLAQARALRDQLVRKNERAWTEIRLALGKDVVGSSKLHREMAPAEDETDRLIDGYAERIHSLAARTLAKHEDGDPEALDRAIDAVTESGEGHRLHQQIQVLQGKLTPLAPLGEVWLDTKVGTNPKTLSDYRLAFSLLITEYPFKEDITWSRARAFLSKLLKTKAKGTVQKYTIAYKGLWLNEGWHLEAPMWSCERMNSSIKTLKRRPYSDEEWLRLMNGIRDMGNRRLWLACRIAAHSGASLSGISKLQLRGMGTAEPSLYLIETKKEHRTRLVPCHPAILQDAVEWCKRPLANQSITNAFSEAKRSLGFGPEHVFHGFRHSVASRLENARIPDREVKRLLGHLIGNITFDTYSAYGLDYPVLAQVVGALHWPDVSW